MMPISTASYHSRVPFAKSQLLVLFLLWLTAHGDTLDYPLPGVLQTSEFMPFSNMCMDFAGAHNLTIWDAPKSGFFFDVTPGALKVLGREALWISYSPMKVAHLCLRNEAQYWNAIPRTGRLLRKELHECKSSASQSQSLPHLCPTTVCNPRPLLNFM